MSKIYTQKEKIIKVLHAMEGGPAVGGHFAKVLSINNNSIIINVKLIHNKSLTHAFLH